MPSRRTNRALAGLVGMLAAISLFTPDLQGAGLNLTTLVSFNGPDGGTPYAGLTRGTDGYLYGTTFRGGPLNQGTVFRTTTSGGLLTLVSFTNSNGARPYAGLTQGPDGYLYGTTSQGGANNLGTVFRLTTNGAFTTLISFGNTNGASPADKLLLHTNGIFYGTTFSGGDDNLGTVFQMTLNGLLTTLISFSNTNGAEPYADLIQGADGLLYGTTVNGGTNGGWGTIFRLSTNGNLTTLFSFSGTNGAQPYGGLTQDKDGTLYGVTLNGGIGFDGSVESGFGTVFRMTTNGVLQSIHFFSGGDDGWNPLARLVPGGDGYFYGTTILGGTNGYGTVFQITTNGQLANLISFNFDENGISPHAELLPGTRGSFYGTTSGPVGRGTVFRISPSAPRLRATPGANATLTLSWDSLRGQAYQVQFQTEPTQSNWTNLGNSIVATNSSVNTTDSTVGSLKRFYRVGLVFPP